jgi:hypothetical protein
LNNASFKNVMEEIKAREAWLHDTRWQLDVKFSLNIILWLLHSARRTLGAARTTKAKLSGQPSCSIIRITLWNGYGASFATELSRSLGDTVVLTVSIWIHRRET